MCPPGYYCVTGNPEPIQCPKGHYCEAEVEVPTKCRIRTYSNSLGAFSSNTCTICPGGYLCNEEAIVDYTAYPC